MLKDYLFNGKQFQFNEGEQPEGAVEVKVKPPKAEAEQKAIKPANKARTVKNK